MVSGLSRHVDAMHPEWLVHVCVGRETDRQRWDRDRERQIETQTGRERETCFSRKPSTGI